MCQRRVGSNLIHTE